MTDSIVTLPDGKPYWLADPTTTEFCTIDLGELRRYQDHVVRWASCAPAGAVFLRAPLQGWDGTPCTTRGAVGTFGGGCNPAMRAARLKRGLNPFGPTVRVAA